MTKQDNQNQHNLALNADMSAHSSNIIFKMQSLKIMIIHFLILILATTFAITLYIFNYQDFNFLTKYFQLLKYYPDLALEL